MKKFLNKIKEFLLNQIRGKSDYSIKKELTWLFVILVFYVVIFTSKEYLELLGFICLLLGIRSYDKLKYFNGNGKNNNENTNNNNENTNNNNENTNNNNENTNKPNEIG